MSLQCLRAPTPSLATLLPRPSSCVRLSDVRGALFFHMPAPTCLSQIDWRMEMGVCEFSALSVADGGRTDRMVRGQVSHRDSLA